ncbi:DUF4252 domain-containing protein [Bacteroides sp. 224]|uniref:DUF4252 domain-containing protein n=1 Tax=Bacteroides sp. 224 TaxID=2302936 RepID=UPI0013D55B9D|nr:DUF4252 domain-containing protein [Bacteroides sp. 224]NDV66589.1 hypothetical protein [Bacteroides sp. 224]
MRKIIVALILVSFAANIAQAQVSFDDIYRKYKEKERVFVSTEEEVKSLIEGTSSCWVLESREKDKSALKEDIRIFIESNKLETYIEGIEGNKQYGIYALGEGWYFNQMLIIEEGEKVYKVMYLQGKYLKDTIKAFSFKTDTKSVFSINGNMLQYQQNRPNESGRGGTIGMQRSTKLSKREQWEKLSAWRTKNIDKYQIEKVREDEKNGILDILIKKRLSLELEAVEDEFVRFDLALFVQIDCKEGSYKVYLTNKHIQYAFLKSSSEMDAVLPTGLKNRISQQLEEINLFNSEYFQSKYDRPNCWLLNSNVWDDKNVGEKYKSVGSNFNTLYIMAEEEWSEIIDDLVQAFGDRYKMEHVNKLRKK